MKGKDPIVAENATRYRRQFGRYTISAPTLTELVKGFHKLGREDRKQRMMLGLVTEEVIGLDINAAMIAGRIYGELEKSGQPIGRLDPFIAAIAIQYDLVLVTGNIKHFERAAAMGFPLKLANWREQV
jgi:tRNA(fMet)-specific endonuclease VapC